MNNRNVGSYKPSGEEEYMNPTQLAYFKTKLLVWRGELIQEAKIFKAHLKETKISTSDPIDQGATQEGVEKGCFDMARQQKYLRKIDHALELIEDGEYGYCEVSGKEIGLKRLEVQPIATMTVEVQELSEKYVNHAQLARLPVCLA